MSKADLMLHLTLMSCSICNNFGLKIKTAKTLHDLADTGHCTFSKPETSCSLSPQEEIKKLSDLVQARLTALQNPKNCSYAKKLVCNLNARCGFGCLMHHITACFLLAYGTERMLVLQFPETKWRYEEKFEDLFLQLSDECPNPLISQGEAFPGMNNAPTVFVNATGLFELAGHKFLPPSMPADIAGRLTPLHNHPVVWWVGQFLQYILRTKQDVTKMLSDMETDIGFIHPIVGVHIRRTDKNIETIYYDIEDYMFHVEEFYKDMSLKAGKIITKKLVYLASDDPKIYKVCRKKYPDYTFLGKFQFHNTESLLGIVIDIHFLSHSDFLVSTFTSNVGLVVYEIMQQFHVDASDRFHSLDYDWQFWEQGDSERLAILDHNPKKGEIALRIGDIIKVEKWDYYQRKRIRVKRKNSKGMGRGMNQRTGKVGLYPLHKTKDVVKTAYFPLYHSVHIE